MPDVEAASAALRQSIRTRKSDARLRGDLDWIVIKALEKDRNRRYETPTTSRWTSNVISRTSRWSARPPNTLYRLESWSSAIA
jgi:eukaryotic-like serine/threonine-protein kinase